MSDSPKPFPGEGEIEAQAAAWAVRHDRGLTRAEQEELALWLAADPWRRDRFDRHRQAWDRLGRLAELKSGGGAGLNPDLLAPRRSRLALLLPLSLAAAAAVALMIFRAPQARNPAAAAPAAVTLVYGSNVLADGSVVDLDRDAAAEVRYTPGERDVELTRGGASFAVAKNHQRPFVVHAAGVAVRAVGTAFVVRLKTESVEVLVTEGRVLVSPPPAPASGPATKPYTMAAGDSRVISLGIRAAHPLPAASALAAGDDLLPARPALLDLDGKTLYEIVAEFNRRNPVQLRVADPDLGAMQVGGLVRSDNVEGFVSLLRQKFDVDAQPDGKTIILRRKR